MFWNLLISLGRQKSTVNSREFVREKTACREGPYPGTTLPRFLGKRARTLITLRRLRTHPPNMGTPTIYPVMKNSGPFLGNGHEIHNVHLKLNSSS